MRNPRSKTPHPGPYTATVKYSDGSPMSVIVRIFHCGDQLFYLSVGPTWYDKLLREDLRVARVIKRARQRADALLKVFQENEKR